MATKEEYIQLMEKFKNEVETYYPKAGFSMDGPVNSENWFSNTNRFNVLFLLKEAYWDPTSEYSIMDNINRYNDSNTNKSISKTMYAIQQVCSSEAFKNNLMDDAALFQAIDTVYDTLPGANSDAFMQSFEQIAVVEIKKTAGGTSSNDQEIRNHGKQFSSLLTKQIELLNPHIIICGGPITWEVLTKELTLFDRDTITSDERKAYVMDNYIVFNTYHPSSNHIHWYDKVFDICKRYHRKLHAIQKRSNPKALFQPGC